jgi:hypothetical protein
MSIELFFAKGYSAPAYRPGEEAALLMEGQWSPSSVDFAAAAKNSGGGTGVGTLDEIIDEIGKKSAGSIDELGIIAHANQNFFSLSGTVLSNGPNLPNVTFSKTGMVDADRLKDRKSKIDAVQDRFAKGARIVLYGCHSGLDDALLQAMAKSFGVCVYGFSIEIGFLIQWNTSTKAVTSRGKTFLADDRVAAGLEKPTTLAQDDIHKLTPDKKSSADCPGYKTKTSSTTPAPTASVGSGGRSK